MENAGAEQDQLAATVQACQTRVGPGFFHVNEKNGANLSRTYNGLHVAFWEGLALESYKFWSGSNAGMFRNPY